jgi:hypothetical protein
MQMNRQCGDCTKCCEGHLVGEALGKSFFKSKPCHFVAIGNGCTVYEERPKNPCASYKCEWLINPEIPEYMKPNLINTIIEKRKTKSGIEYLNVVEAGAVLKAGVLSNLLLHALGNRINIAWEVEGGKNWIGSEKFLEEMDKAHTV